MQKQLLAIAVAAFFTCASAATPDKHVLSTLQVPAVSSNNGTSNFSTLSGDEVTALVVGPGINGAYRHSAPLITTLASKLVKAGVHPGDIALPDIALLEPKLEVAFMLHYDPHRSGNMFTNPGNRCWKFATETLFNLTDVDPSLRGRMLAFDMSPTRVVFEQ